MRLALLLSTRPRAMAALATFLHRFAWNAIAADDHLALTQTQSHVGVLAGVGVHDVRVVGLQ